MVFRLLRRLSENQEATANPMSIIIPAYGTPVIFATLPILGQPSKIRFVVSGYGSVKKFFNISVAILVSVFNSIRVIIGIKVMPDFPLVSHAVMIFVCIRWS